MNPIRTLAATLLLLTSSLALLPVTPAGAQVPGGDEFQACLEDSNQPDKTVCLNALVEAQCEAGEIEVDGECVPATSQDPTADCPAGQLDAGQGCAGAPSDAECEQFNAQEPKDQLFGILCSFLLPLDATTAGPVNLFVQVERYPDGRFVADYDEDGRPDRVKVRGTFPPTPPSPAPGPKVSSIGPYYVQVDYFYTPAGATNPFAPETQDFDYPAPGVMLYHPQTGNRVDQVPTNLRFTDHYQGAPGNFAIYEFDADDHWGAAVLAHSPGSSSFESGRGVRILLDVDRTPFLGDGCDGHALFAGQPLEAAACDNSIDEGDGGAGGAPTWIRLQIPGETVPETEFMFFDGKGLMLDDLHFKWPTDDPEGSAPIFVDYLAFSNLDNDANTDFEELSCPSGEVTNPTNPSTSCEDVDGDGIPRATDPDDKSPNPSVELAVRVTKADGTAIPTQAPYAAAPLAVDILYTCKVNVGAVTALTLDFNWDFNGITTAPAQTYSLPTADCDGLEHSLGDAAGEDAVFVYLAGSSTPTKLFTLNLDATNSMRPAPGASTTFRVLGTQVFDVELVADGDFAPVSLAGSSVTCASTHAFVAGAIDYDLGSDGSAIEAGSPSAFGCSGAGTVTAFDATYFFDGSSGHDLVFTADFSDANDPRFTVAVPVDNLAETATLAATGCTGTCYNNAPSITWQLTPGAGTLANEDGQGWDSIKLYKDSGATHVGDMTLDVPSGKYVFTEASRAVSSNYVVKVVDAGHRLSSFSLNLQVPNDVPDVEEYQAPLETGYTLNTADPSLTTVDTQFFALVTDLGPAGRASNTGEVPATSMTVKVEFLTATNLDGSPAAVPAAVTLGTGPACPGTPGVGPAGIPASDCAAAEANGKTHDGELFRGPAKLSPLLSYTYRFTAKDAVASGGDTGVSIIYTLKAAIDADAPASTPPEDAVARPLSFAFLLAGGAAQAVLTEIGNAQAAIEAACRTEVAAAADAQECAENVLYEDVCGLPDGPHDPTQLPDCNDAQSTVAAAVAFVYGVVEDIACNDGHELTGDCASDRVSQAQAEGEQARDQAIAFIENTVCVEAGLGVACEDEQDVPILDPVAVLTRRNGCNFLDADEWASGAGNGDRWEDSCNSATIEDPAAVVTDLLDLLLGDGVPDVPLPFGDQSSHNLPNDAGTNRGTSDEPNGQADLVESRILGYRFDGAEEDPDDPFDAGNELGVTLFVGNPGTQQVANPRHGFIVRIGDVEGTSMRELLVVEDLRTTQAPRVTCVGIESSPGTVDSVYVHEGQQRFRANGDAPLDACGPATQSSAIRVDYDVESLAEGTLGLMVWEDRDANGVRVPGSDADAGKAGLPTEDIVGFRLHVDPTAQPNLRIDVNVRSDVSTIMDDGLTARLSIPDSVIGPVLPDASASLIVFSNGDVRIEAEVYGRSGASAWEPYTGPLTLSLQRDCQKLGGLDAAVRPDLEEAAAEAFQEAPDPLCYPGGDMDDYTVTVTGTLVSPGHYAFAVPGSIAKQRLFYQGAGVTDPFIFGTIESGIVMASAVHAWVEAPGSASNYFVPAQPLFNIPATETQAGVPPVVTGDQPADPALIVADLLDSLWTPIPILFECEPNPLADDPTVDSDQDGVLDGCDLTDDKDTDEDGVNDPADNCPAVANADQANRDGDGQGDVCDADDDNDGKLDGADQCPLGQTGTGTDTDGDGCKDDGEDANDDGDALADASDNCPTVVNDDQANHDGDEKGNACDSDDDNDGEADAGDACALGETGWTSSEATDLDSDGCRDDSSEDLDDDNDTVLDGADNCPAVANTDQADADDDGEGDACEPASDGDGDGVADPSDNCPTVPNAGQGDIDGDSFGDACDGDDDGDGVEDVADRCAGEGAPDAPLGPLGTVWDPAFGTLVSSPVFNGCPDQRGLGDGFVAAFTLPSPAPALVLDGNSKAITVVVREEGVAVGGGSYTLYVQVDCGALQAATAVVPVECSGGDVDDVKSVAKGFTAVAAGASITLTHAELAGLLQAPLPGTFVHIFVEDAAGRQSNFALPTAALLAADRADAADVLDSQLWHPVPLVAAGALPTPCTPPEVGVEPDCGAPTPCTPPEVGVEPDCQAVPAPTPCTPPEVGVEPDCQTLPVPAPCTPPEVGVEPDCQEVEVCPSGTIGLVQPLCLPEPAPCEPGTIGPAAPACLETPPELACLEDQPVACLDGALDLVGAALCSAAGDPEGSLPGCLAGAPDELLALACSELGLCDSDGDGVPEPVDDCNGDPLSDDCPAPDPNDTLGGLAPCSDPLSFGVGTVCVDPAGGPLSRALGLDLPGIIITLPGIGNVKV